MILQNYLPSTKISAIQEIDPSSDDFPNNQVRLNEASDLASSPQMATISKYKTRQRDRMLQNVGTKIRRVFFITDLMDPPISSTVLLGL